MIVYPHMILYIAWLKKYYKLSIVNFVKELGVDEFQGYYFYEPSTTLVSEALV